METVKMFDIGQRVQYRSGGNWKPFGVIVEIQDGMKMNDAVLFAPRYKVQWDDGDESGWLSYHDLQPA